MKKMLVPLLFACGLAPLFTQPRPLPPPPALPPPVSAQTAVPPRITALALDSSGRQFAAVYGGATALIYERLPDQNRTVETRRWRVDGGAEHIAFTDAGEIVTAKDGTVRVFNQHTGAPVRTIASINSYNTSRPLTPEEQRDGVTLPWSAKTSAVAAFIGNGRRVLTLSFNEEQPNRGKGGIVTLIAPHPPQLRVEAADVAENERAALVLAAQDSSRLDLAFSPPDGPAPSDLSLPYFSKRSLFAAGENDRLLVCTGSVMQLWKVRLTSQDILLNRQEAAVQVVCAKDYGAETISAAAMGGSGRESLFAFAHGTAIDVCDASTFAVAASIKTGAPVSALAFNMWGDTLAAATDAGITLYTFRKEATGYAVVIIGGITFRN